MYASPLEIHGGVQPHLAAWNEQAGIDLILHLLRVIGEFDILAVAEIVLNACIILIERFRLNRRADDCALGERRRVKKFVVRPAKHISVRKRVLKIQPRRNEGLIDISSSQGFGLEIPVPPKPIVGGKAL